MQWWSGATYDMVIYIYHLRDDPPEMRSASREKKPKGC